MLGSKVFAQIISEYHFQLHTGWNLQIHSVFIEHSLYHMNSVCHIYSYLCNLYSITLDPDYISFPIYNIVLCKQQELYCCAKHLYLIFDQTIQAHSQWTIDYCLLIIQSAIFVC